MTLNAIAAGFKEKSIFNEDLPREDDLGKVVLTVKDSKMISKCS